MKKDYSILLYDQFIFYQINNQSILFVLYEFALLNSFMI
jgi:hypothetical protein